MVSLVCVFVANKSVFVGFNLLLMNECKELHNSFNALACDDFTSKTYVRTRQKKKKTEKAF